ncbi:PAS domain-containing protein [Actinoplanes sp. CA-015351]|uniref:PAS domain-containing protein n=1 Tax=Actinoplanes sp. CA-015351 TaxID=3239897 RepID=UPI003D9588EE
MTGADEPRKRDLPVSARRGCSVVVSLAENSRPGARLGEIRLLESMLRHSSEIISIAGADGKFLQVSPAVERLLGLPVTDVLGRPARDFWYAEDRAVTP